MGPDPSRPAGNPPDLRRKYFIKMPGSEPLSPALGVVLGSPKSTSTPFTRVSREGDVEIRALTEEQVERLRERNVEVWEDFHFEPFPGHETWWVKELSKVPEPPWSRLGQGDVLNHIRAQDAWQRSRGEGVTIAIVDTGVADRCDFPTSQRSPYSVSLSNGTPWADSMGHGTMCAAIACGSSEGGGKYDGVAPRATLLSARSTLDATDLYFLYEYLLTKKLEGCFSGGLVVSNSFGIKSCMPPSFPNGHPYIHLVKQCIENGIVFVFAAGNNHAICGYPEGMDHPNTIWGVNSLDEAICVGTVDWHEVNDRPASEHAHSSRGPGQWSLLKDKPDVVAPTYGEVAWADDYQIMEWWGTSGACPQVAGLAALLLATFPHLTPAEIKAIIKASARRLSKQTVKCVGQGLIDCGAALSLAVSQIT